MSTIEEFTAWVNSGNYHYMWEHEEPEGREDGIDIEFGVTRMMEFGPQTNKWNVAWDHQHTFIIDHRDWADMSEVRNLEGFDPYTEEYDRQKAKALVHERQALVGSYPGSMYILTWDEDGVDTIVTTDIPVTAILMGGM